MSSISTPIAFSANTIIRSADVNTNFTNINTVVNGNIDNTNIVAGAAIAYSKLNLATSIVNADIAAAAAIAVSKLAALTASRAAATDASGFLTTSATTSTELGYVSGVTSAIQTQINAKMANPLTTTGDIIYSSSGTTPARIGIGSSGQVLKVTGGVPAWAAAPSGGINYIAPNQDAEVDTTGWATYADAAGNTPVNGIDGSPTTTWTRTTTDPLRGTGSYLWTRDAANRQGEGVSYDFSIDNADLAQPLAISFDFKVVSGTFFAADGITAPSNNGTTTQNAGMSDIEVFMYDVTNSVLIPVTPQVLTSSSTLPVSWKGRFQAASNSTSYRLCLHTARSTAVAFTAQFDNFKVGPEAVNYGYAGTDADPFTPTGSWVSNATYTGFKSRVGDSLVCDVKIALTGAPNSASLTVNLPAGLTIDTAKMNSVVADGTAQLGDGYARDNATAEAYLHVLYNSPTSVKVFYETAGAFGTVTQAAPWTWANTDGLSFRFMVPIAGWSSNVQMSNDTDTRVVAAILTGDAASATSGNPIIFPTATLDTHGAYGTGTGLYTVPVSGIYEVSTYLEGGTSGFNISVFKNSSAYLRIGYVDSSNNTAGGSALVSCVAGDTLSVRPGGTFDSGSVSQMCIRRVSGPAAIAASEKVFVNYTSNGGTAITADVTNITWSTKVADSHSAWNGTTFTAPRAGFYIVSGMWRLTTSVVAWGYVYVNGAQTRMCNYTPTAQSLHPMMGAGIYLNAGDILSIRSDTNATLSNTNGTLTHWISISSQG